MSDTFANPFAAVDVAAIPDDPFLHPAGVFEGVVESLEIKPTKKGDKVGMTILYAIPETNMKVTDWLQVPQPADPQKPTGEETQQFSRMKQRLLQLGVAEKDMGKWTPEDIAGRSVAIKIAHRTQTNKETGEKSTQHQVREVEYLG